MPSPLVFPGLNPLPLLRSLCNQFLPTLEIYFRALYLFTYSDHRTTLIPVTVFAYFSAPNTSIGRMVYSGFWTWLHLLQFCVSNQIQEPDEDAVNKPWRPIPSGLISVAVARALRWILLILCPSLSMCLGTHWYSISLALATFAYHELQFHSHGLMRNVCNAWGYACFNAGAAMIAAGQSMLPARTAISVAVNTLIILSTIHSQDFRDQAGDKRAGRWTIPIAWPEGSRISILVILPAWSAGLSWACDLAYVLSVPFCVLSIFIGLRFIQKRTVDDDKLSYQLYNIWLVAAKSVHTPMISTVLSNV